MIRESSSQLKIVSLLNDHGNDALDSFVIRSLGEFLIMESKLTIYICFPIIPHFESS